MDTKHTPGPWRLGTPGPNGCYTVGTEKGLMVCMVAHSTNYLDQAEQAIGDARLIAAAPCLLGALADLYGAMDSCIELTPEIMDNAFAAINKAIGEPWKRRGME